MYINKLQPAISKPNHFLQMRIWNAFLLTLPLGRVTNTCPSFSTWQMLVSCVLSLEGSKKVCVQVMLALEPGTRKTSKKNINFSTFYILY